MSEDSQRWTRKEFLTFSIEEIWKEMEEINRARKATQELFQQFQDTYFDRPNATERRDIVDSPTPDNLENGSAVSMRSSASSMTTIQQGKRPKSQAKVNSMAGKKKPFA